MKKLLMIALVIAFLGFTGIASTLAGEEERARKPRNKKNRN